MLTALLLALQYLLPFNDAEPSPLRAAGRIHLVVPNRFRTQVCVVWAVVAAKAPSHLLALSSHRSSIKRCSRGIRTV